MNKRVKTLSIIAGILIVANLVIGFVLLLQVFRNPIEYGRGLVVTQLTSRVNILGEEYDYDTIDAEVYVRNLDKETKTFRVVFYYIVPDTNNYPIVVEVYSGIRTVPAKQNSNSAISHKIERPESGKQILFSDTEVGIVRIDVYTSATPLPPEATQ